MSNNFDKPTQYEVGSITIEGNDVVGLMQMISIFESIYSPVITGSIVLLDTDGSDFISKYEIEGSEEIEFDFTNANDEQLTFKGVLNGLRNKAVKNQTNMYTFDFTSEQVRKNEEKFVTKRFKNKEPKAVIEEMIELLGGETDKVEGDGLPMSFLGSRKRPTDIIKYALTHGVTQESSSSEKGKSREEKTEGTTGFACWQTLDGYRFNSIDKILKGEGGNDVGSFTHQMQNHGVSMKEAMASIVDYDFKEIGDIQSKMRSGAFRNVVISFDIDKGLYKEFEYADEKNMTEKQKKAVTKPTRYMWKPYSNERFENQCTKAKDNEHDQSRRYLAQNNVRQNTFADQFGNFTLPPSFKIRAGDYFEAKIPKVESEGEGGYNDKHSGRYVIKQVGHHIMNDGHAYTRVQTIRSTTQQDDSSSQK
ncbi:hypothetical protein [Synechococcus phage S-H34]|uniref:Uncharacterized protein n=1 Tax=Synechococcus phage S-H34 TaxID=2718942 RepID=A0A6G8R6R2_9CAUD|nr:tail protein [Synechococcus phage S-H34]QIN97066.1 hypothetical protein [Synechococcus phage S-H34]